MSAATATYTVGAYEVFMCGGCRMLFGAGTDMEVTADPEGHVTILCPSCAEKGEEIVG